MTRRSETSSRLMPTLISVIRRSKWKVDCSICYHCDTKLGLNRPFLINSPSPLDAVLRDLADDTSFGNLPNVEETAIGVLRGVPRYS
jgi:hypothetical protein